MLDRQRRLRAAPALRDVRQREAEDDGHGRGVVHGDAGVQPADAVEVGARHHLVHDGGHDPREVVEEGLRRGAAVEVDGGEGVDLGAGDGGPGVGRGGGGGEGGEGGGGGGGGGGGAEGEVEFDVVGGWGGVVEEGGFCGVVGVGGGFPAFGARSEGGGLALHLGPASFPSVDVGAPRWRAGLHARVLARGALRLQACSCRGRLPRLFLLRNPRRGFPPRARFLAAALLEAFAAAVFPHHVFTDGLPRLLCVFVDDELEFGLEGCGGGAGRHGLEERGGGGGGGEGGGGGVTAVHSFG